MEYKISDFAIISRLSIKTLRYYHEIGLLAPSRIERSNGYRYYDGCSLVRVRAIQQLKTMYFSLAEISELLDGPLNPAGIQEMIQQKVSEVEQQIQLFEQTRKRLQTFLRTQTLPLMIANPVIEKELPEILIASIRFNGQYQMLNEKITLLMKICGAAVCGPPFSLYYDNHAMDEDADIEICVPVKQAVESDPVHSRNLPGGSAVTVLHKGYYDQISLSYQVIVENLNLQKIKPIYPTRELYLVGGYADSPDATDQYLTEIQFLVA